MIGVDGMWKRIMELAVFALGWQTSTAGTESIWMTLFLIYLLYICWQLYEGNIKPLLSSANNNKEGKA